MAKIFIANSEIDGYDPKKEILNSMTTFSKKVADNLGNRVNYRYETYDKFGHVPYRTYYDVIWMRIP